MKLDAQNPTRLDWLLITFLAVVTFGTIFGAYSAIRWLSAIFLVAVIASRAWRLAPCAILFFLLYVGEGCLPVWLLQLPTVTFLAPLAFTWVISQPFGALRNKFGWFRKGSPDQVTWFLVILVSLISAVALILWALWTNYLGLAGSMISTIRAYPRWLMLFFGIPGFALLNAFAEECIYRGVLQDALAEKFRGRLWLLLGAQASAFAAVHYAAGFPNGKIGYAMTFLYAGMLGYLRERSEGMLAPFVAHVMADLVIGITLLLLVTG